MTISSFLSATPQTTTGAPFNPGGTASATAVMMGIGKSFTPVKSGKVLVLVCGTVTNSTISDGAGINYRYGTGGAPVNGAAATGTASSIATQNVTVAAAAELIPFCIVGTESLTPNTTYWFDLQLNNITGGTATLTQVSFSIVEWAS